MQEGNNFIKLVSIVIPCFNEADNIKSTLDELLEFAKNHKYDFEIIVVDDGSIDKTWEVIKTYAQNNRSICGIQQMANFGQSQAYQAGFDMAKGDYIVLLSADLEIKIENINTVINLLDEGFDFVNTNRVKRWGKSLLKKAKSDLANFFIRSISKVRVSDRGSGLKGMRYNVAKRMNLYGDMHRFLPDYASSYGAKITEFDVEFSDRTYGKSAYKGSSRAFKVLLDMITLTFMLYFARKPFFMMPGRLFGTSGVIMSAVGSIITLVLIIERIIFLHPLSERPLFILGIITFLLGIILILFGVFGELLMRVYFESTGRKLYMSREITKKL